MRRITLVLLISPLILLTLGCNNRAKKLKALQEQKEVIKELNESIVKGGNIDLKQFIRDADACVDFIFNNAVSEDFKKLSAEEKEKAKKDTKDLFVLREGILNGEWNLVEDVAKRENAFELNVQDVAELKDYFNDPNKAPEGFMKTEKVKPIVLWIYINAKFRGKTDICKKLEGDTSVLKGYRGLPDGPKPVSSFEDYFAKPSVDDLKKKLLEHLKAVEAHGFHEMALILRMFFGIPAD